MEKKFIICDGNQAATNIAYKFSEVAAIYPITPSSPMGELADLWASQGKLNLLSTVPKVQEMQSEGGAAGAIHGSLTAGALTTTFTASQGLLLMLPNMFKIAGEMLPTVFHVASRSLACQSLSIFGDHSDVMAARTTGFALLSSANVQQAQDLAVIAHLATLESKIPFLHFFDGFRTSHEIKKIEEINDETLKSMINEEYIKNFKSRAINPEKPFVKVGAQNPDVYFQGRETVNKYYDVTPEIVEKYMKLFEEKTKRKYELFEYYGSPTAEKIIIAMGSGTDTIKETLDYLNDKKLGCLIIHLYRPFSIKHFIDKIPKTIKKIAVLDRTKEPGSIGEPLYLDVVTSLNSTKLKPEIYGGRYGLSSKEFTPSMVKSIYDFLDDKPHHNFTVGITDDVTNLSIPIKEEISTVDKSTIQCKFWGYGSDGTVSANKNTIKIIGETTNKFIQAHFEYDSKKSGGVTISHLRFSDKQINSEYDVENSDIIALHKCSYIKKYNILKGIKKNGIFLINSHYKPEELFENLPELMQKQIIENNIKVYTINALEIAKEVGLGNRINTIMQTAFFKLANIIPFDESLKLIKEHTKKTFEIKGQKVVDMNITAIDMAINSTYEVPIKQTSKHLELQNLIPENSDEFTKNVVLPIMKLEGNSIPVSQMSFDGTIPTNTTRLEKRCATDMVPVWDKSKCIQCGMCSFVCPHAAIRTKQIHSKDLENSPKTFETLDVKNQNDLKFKVQVYPEDCTGCTHCVKQCPTGALRMISIEEAFKNNESENEKFFDNLPDNILDGAIPNTIKESQLRKPFFEFSGACSGCGETPYIKLVTQFFGDRMIIANATGCSSIYGGTFPTIPFSVNKNGEGPAWANSLFEDNAEYGFGMRIAINQIRNSLKEKIKKLIEIGTTKELKELLEKLLQNYNKTNDETKKLVQEIKKQLQIASKEVYGESEPILKQIIQQQNYLMEKSVWIIGGDGWAYDIGFGGLDHVASQKENVNILILDNEQYANTGGQCSKSTPRGATAKFAISGKEQPKKNLGLMMMSYGNVYIASINIDANKIQAIKAIKEAEEYDGPSIIIAYSNCINHGLNMEDAEKVSKDATASGYWPLYRYNPKLENPLTWDSPENSIEFKDYVAEQNRYNILKRTNPNQAEKLISLAKLDNEFREKMIKNFQNK
ncbi:MAG: pyruvate:ferredoxin (flavodoxin) oxidoreductase [Candidatus Woesearchaeota archaeon]